MQPGPPRRVRIEILTGRPRLASAHSQKIGTTLIHGPAMAPLSIFPKNQNRNGSYLQHLPNASRCRMDLTRIYDFAANLRYRNGCPGLADVCRLAAGIASL